MRRPRHGIRSTTPKATARQLSIHVPAITVPLQPAASIRDGLEQVSGQVSEQVSEYNSQWPNLIGYDGDESIANVFVFGAFVDKISGIIYHDLTGSFPFMSLDGSICFFILYHYKSNCILASPIDGLDDKSIFAAYEKRFKELESKGFKPKLNVMDNQATKHIKQFLTKNECRLQLVEPHNHHVNAAERAIQMFKDAFIAAFTTTDSYFPLQLWDKITPQVQDMLNMMRASRSGSHQISIWSAEWTIQLELVSTRTTGMQSSGVWGWRHTRIMGFTRSRRVVPRSPKGPLLVGSLLHFRDKSVLHIRVNWIVPPTLSNTMFDTAPTFSGTDGRIGWSGGRIKRDTCRETNQKNTADEDQTCVKSARCSGRTKGDGAGTKGGKREWIKGDRWHPHSHHPMHHRLGCTLLFVLLLRLDLDHHSNLCITRNTAYYWMVMLSRGVIWPMTTTILACLGIVLNHSNTQ